MAAIESVTGPIDEADLGTTLIHEHLRFRDDATANEFPHLYDDDALFAAGVEAAEKALRVGVKTIGEPTAMFGGRDVRFMRAVAEKTGLQVVPCTGIYTYDYLPLNWQTRSEDEMADAFVHDIEQGIQGTDIKAAFLKCAADQAGVTENVEKVHRACARASLRTGKPIMAHSHPGTGTGPRQVEIFNEEGVDPSQVQIAHTGDTDDLDYIEGLLQSGVFIGLDRYGIEMYLPTDKRNATVLALLERGHVEQMHLSMDSCASIDWFNDAAAEALMEQGAIRDWDTALLHEQVVPALKEGGMTDEQLETMLVENTRRWLAPAG
jgi:phosphotriesterase-related protein